MHVAYVGEDAFRAGVRNYMRPRLREHDVQRPVARIQAAAGKPVLDIAHDFTLQPGVPLIRVEAASCANDATTLTLLRASSRGSTASRRWRGGCR